MTKTKIIVERFDQGITTRWYEEGGSTATNKSLATSGREHIIIGQDIWDDVSEMMDKEMTDKVMISIELEAMPK